MKIVLYLVLAVFIASLALAHDTPPPIEDGCYVHVAHPPATCDGGDIIQDDYDSCRVIVCSDNESSLSVMACGKPDNAATNSKEYFEMYKLFEVGPAQLEVCLGDACLSNNGYVKSELFPICPESQDPICGDGIINQEFEQCDGFSGVGENQECTDNCALINTTYCGDGIVQEPNDDGMYEECDGSAPDGYECTKRCELNSVTCEESICDIEVTCDGQITEGNCRSCRTVTCENNEGSSTILACEKPNEPPHTYFEMYLIDQNGSAPEVCLGETCVNPKYTGFARSEQGVFACEEPICGDGVVNQESEQCDDGNNETGDGCDNQCQLEEEQTATLTVIKVIQNDDGGNATVDDWDYMINNTIVQNGTANELLPGTYVVHEILTSPLEVGYSATFSGDCDVNGTVELEWNDNKTCIITNDDIGEEEPLGSITIRKNVDTEEYEGMLFDFIFNNVLNFSISENGEAFVVGNLSAGNYSVVESVPQGWDLSSVDCGPNDNTGLADGLTVVLSAGENEDCTFNNQLIVEECEIDHRTQTQGGWGSTANGDNPGTYRDANFAGAFPSGVMIGINDSRYALWTSSAAVEAFLPTGGPSGALTANTTNATSTDAGTLAGQALATTLSLGFDVYDANFSNSTTPLADLVLNGGTCIGMTVQEVLDSANNVLAGKPSPLSASDVNDCLSTINENFVDGTTDKGDLVCELLIE